MSERERWPIMQKRRERELRRPHAAPPHLQEGQDPERGHHLALVKNPRDLYE